MNRRKFIKSTGFSAAFALISGMGVRVENLFAARKARSPKDLLESWPVSTCAECNAGCGIKVRLLGSRVIGIRGNEDNPVSRGGLCARGFAGIQSLYNPDRLKGPLMASAENDTSRWRGVSWDEALGALSEKLSKRRKGSNSIMLLTGDRDSLTVRILKRFLSSLGSEAVLFYPWGDSRMAHPAVHIAHGIQEPLTYDVENATYILSFSSDFLQSGSSHVNLSNAFGKFRGNASRPRGKFVHFDPRLSITASKADEWIAVKPQTEGAVALAIANTLLEEGLYNKRFVTEECVGFDEWVDERGNRHPGFRSVVLREFSPQKVSEVSGVSTETIIKVAREFAGSSRPLSIGCDRIDFSYQDLFTRLAVHTLNALAGNIDQKGGIVIPRKIPPGDLADTSASISSPPQGSVWEGGAMFRFPVSLYETDSTLDALLSWEPPEVLFIYKTNPLFTSSRKKEWTDFIKKAGFVVTFSSFLDETSACAHLILPDSHYLEKWNAQSAWTSTGYPVFSVSGPVIEPLHDTRCSGDVIIELAKRSAGNDKNVLHWSSFEEVIKDEARKIYRARRGDVFGPRFEEMWVRLLERIGWRASTYPDFETFWKKCVEKGGWWDPIYYHGKRERVFKNEYGKFDFGIDLVRNRARQLGTLESLYALDRFRPAEPDEAYPFLLQIHSHWPLLAATSSNTPWLMELMTFQPDQSGEWGMWVEMNPEDAKRAGLHHNDRVVVETPGGRIFATIKLFPGNPAGTLNLPFGLGHTSGGRFVEGIGSNPSELINYKFDQLTGIAMWDSTFARIKRV